MTFDDMMAELQTEYVASIPEKIATIKGHFEAGDIALVQDDFHKLKGTGKTYGLPEVTDLAKEMEQICKTTPDAVGEHLPKALAGLEQIYEQKKS